MLLFIVACVIVMAAVVIEDFASERTLFAFETHPAVWYASVAILGVWLAALTF